MPPLKANLYFLNIIEPKNHFPHFHMAVALLCKARPPAQLGKAIPQAQLVKARPQAQLGKARPQAQLSNLV